MSDTFQLDFFLPVLQVERFCIVGHDDKLSFDILVHPNQKFKASWLVKMIRNYQTIKIKARTMVTFQIIFEKHKICDLFPGSGYGHLKSSSRIPYRI